MAQNAHTLYGLVKRNSEAYGKKPAYREKEFGIWQSWNWAEAAEEIEKLTCGLIHLGLKSGDHVAILGRNRPYFYWAIVAVQAAGGVPVPLYQDSVADEVRYVLDHCKARFVFAENQEQVDKVLDIKDQLADLDSIIYLDSRGMRKYDKSHLHDYRLLQEKGASQTAQLKKELEKRLHAQTDDTTCAMLYTSGTTGRPKGVVLSNGNILETAKASSEFDKLDVDDSVLAYLPMAWVGDFIFSIGQAIWTGFCVNCPENSDTMQHDLKEIGPSYFFAPPRYFESILTDVMIRMEDAGAFKQSMFKYFMAHARNVGGRDRKSVV